MKKRYGIPYQGSKNSIAEWVVEHLPTSPVFVDLFAGGCAVTHCAMLSGKYGEFVANDISGNTEIFADAIGGKYKNERRWISSEEFHRLKKSDAYVRVLWSFNNCQTHYLYSKEREPWARALHFARVLGDCSQFEAFGIKTDGSPRDIKKHQDEYRANYSEWYVSEIRKKLYANKVLKLRTKEEKQRYLRDALTASGLAVAEVCRRLKNTTPGHYWAKSQWLFPTPEHYEELRKFIPLPLEYAECVDPLEQKLQNLQNLQNLQRLHSLQSLQRLQSLQSLDGKGLTVSDLDFTEVKAPGASFFYCDPPYKGTASYNNESFDYDRFESWLHSCGVPCIVSEITAPAGCVEIASTVQKASGMKRGGGGERLEKLFIQEEFADWYRNEMNKTAN